MRTFGIRRNEKIACHVTIRGEKALDLLSKGLAVKEFELRKGNFSKNGALIFFLGRGLVEGTLLLWSPSLFVQETLVLESKSTLISE